MTENLSSATVIPAIARDKTDRVLKWLFEQGSPDATTFRLAPLLDPVVLADEVQLFLLYHQNASKTHELSHEFAPEEIRSLVYRAFISCGQFLATPRAFLVDFLFDDSAVLHKTENTFVKLNALGPYPFIREFATEWFLKHDGDILKADFTKWLSDLDQVVFEFTPTTQLEAYLQPLFDFYKDSTENLRLMIGAYLFDKNIVADFSTGELSSPALITFIKEHLFSGENIQRLESIEAEIDYPVFLNELKQAGINLPPPPKLRIDDPVSYTRSLPLDLFISDKLKQRTIEELFHGSSYEYERLISLINNAMTFEDAMLNLETVLHLQNARPTGKHLAKLERALRMKFTLPEQPDAIR